MSSPVAMDSAASAIARNASVVYDMMEDMDEYLEWKSDPLRYFFSTFTTCAVLMWFGFAGDNLQYYRMNGGLAYAGGATNRSIWAESFGRTGLILFVYRACAFAMCAYYEFSERVLPRVTKNEETEMYGLDMSYFLNLHDWVIHSVTAFFALATLGSIWGLCSRTATADHYVGHNGRCNSLGHWIMSLYAVAFTASVVFLITVLFEATFAPQCVPSSARGQLLTLLDPASRLCYFEPKYMVAYLGNVVLMLGEASLGRLAFPKCYMSQPIFYLSAFFVMAFFNVFFLGGEWPFEWTNFMRKETMVYVNAFMFLTMQTHYALVKFLRSASNEKSMKSVQERVPLFM